MHSYLAFNFAIYENQKVLQHPSKNKFYEVKSRDPPFRVDPPLAND